MTKNKELITSRKDDNINPYFSNDSNVKYLTCTDQMDMFKPTEYYIVYDLETIEESLDNNFENITIDREDDDSSSSSLSQPSSSSSSSSSPAKSTTKISHVDLLSAAWATKTKSGIKTGYFDRRDGDDFIIKWLQSSVEVADDVRKDNMYECINYTTENIHNFVPLLDFNSARFDMNFNKGYSPQ
jgi:hypothetical protein